MTAIVAIVFDKKKYCPSRTLLDVTQPYDVVSTMAYFQMTVISF